MADSARLRRPFGEGTLSRFSAFVYTQLVTGTMLLLTTLPGLAGLVLLARDAANLPLFALCLLPAGPALSAALVTLSRPRDLTDLHPAATFLRAYRAGARAVLALWVPMLVVLTVIGINLAYRQAAGIPRWWVALLTGIGGVTTLWGVNALLITTFFTFRTRDAARLAAYYLGAAPAVTLATACVVVVAGGVVVIATEAGLALLGAPLTLLLLHAGRPLLDRTRTEFTR